MEWCDLTGPGSASMMRNSPTKFKSAQKRIGSAQACKLDMLFLLNLQLFQRTAKKTSDTLWSRTLIPPQQARKNRGDCTVKRQTSSLRKFGAKLTYSGDSRILLGLVIGVSNEQSSSDTVSRLPLYVQMTLQTGAH